MNAAPMVPAATARTAIAVTAPTVVIARVVIVLTAPRAHFDLKG